MADPENAAPAHDLTTEAATEVAGQPGTPDLVKKVTHEVDAGDMFVQGGE
jgi:hypothetical protein